jgi:hypothetical protein
VPDAQRGNEDQKGKYHCLVVMMMINNNTRSSRVGLMVVTTTRFIIACDDLLCMVVMHTFMDVDGVVDMHPPSFPSFPRCLQPSLPSLFTSTFCLHTYWADANHQINPTTTYRSINT